MAKSGSGGGSPPEALVSAVETIRGLLGGARAAYIKAKVRAGRLILAIRDDTTGKYGPNPMAYVLRSLALGRDAVRPMTVIATMFSDAEVDALLRLRHPVSRVPITWSHLTTLSRLNDREAAAALAAEAVAGGWTARELDRQIRILRPPKSRGGRRHVVPHSYDATLQSVRDKTRLWVNAADQLWLSEDAGLSAAFARAYPDGAAPEAERDRLRAAYDILGVLAARAVRVREVVSGLLRKASHDGPTAG